MTDAKAGLAGRLRAALERPPAEPLLAGDDHSARDDAAPAAVLIAITAGPTQGDSDCAPCGNATTPPGPPSRRPHDPGERRRMPHCVKPGRNSGSRRRSRAIWPSPVPTVPDSSDAVLGDPSTADRPHEQNSPTGLKLARLALPGHPAPGKAAVRGRRASITRSADGETAGGTAASSSFIAQAAWT